MEDQRLNVVHVLEEQIKTLLDEIKKRAERPNDIDAYLKFHQHLTHCIRLHSNLVSVGRLFQGKDSE